MPSDFYKIFNENNNCLDDLHYKTDYGTYYGKVRSSDANRIEEVIKSIDKFQEKYFITISSKNVNLKSSYKPQDTIEALNQLSKELIRKARKISLTRKFFMVLACLFVAPLAGYLGAALGAIAIGALLSLALPGLGFFIGATIIAIPAIILGMKWVFSAIKKNGQNDKLEKWIYAFKEEVLKGINDDEINSNSQITSKSSFQLSNNADSPPASKKVSKKSPKFFNDTEIDIDFTIPAIPQTTTNSFMDLTMPEEVITHSP